MKSKRVRRQYKLIDLQDLVIIITVSSMAANCLKLGEKISMDQVQKWIQKLASPRNYDFGRQATNIFTKWQGKWLSIYS